MTPDGRLRLIEIFEREGLLPALVEAAAILDGDGLDKYGVMGWVNTPKRQIRIKLARHVRRIGTLDHDSGREAGAHAVTRALQLCAIALVARKHQTRARPVEGEA